MCVVYKHVRFLVPFLWVGAFGANVAKAESQQSADKDKVNSPINLHFCRFIVAAVGLNIADEDMSANALAQ